MCHQNAPAIYAERMQTVMSKLHICLQKKHLEALELLRRSVWKNSAINLLRYKHEVCAQHPSITVYDIVPATGKYLLSLLYPLSCMSGHGVFSGEIQTTNSLHFSLHSLALCNCKCCPSALSSPTRFGGSRNSIGIPFDRRPEAKTEHKNAPNFEQRNSLR